MLDSELLQRLMYLKDNLSKIPKWDTDFLRVSKIQIKTIKERLKERDNEFTKGIKNIQTNALSPSI